MYLLIIFLVVATLVSIIWFRNEWIGIVSTFIWLAIIYGLVTLMGRTFLNKDTVRTEYQDLQIVSLQSTQENEFSGAFILGTGGISVNAADYYITYGKFKAGVITYKD